VTATSLVADACPAFQFVVVEWEAVTLSGEDEHPGGHQDYARSSVGTGKLTTVGQG
jgi:hypothetical protein